MTIEINNVRELIRLHAYYTHFSSLKFALTEVDTQMSGVYLKIIILTCVLTITLRERN